MFEAIHSARSIRRLKPDQVPEELITRILDAAIRAPSGGNAQSFAFVVVRDPDLRRQLGVIYCRASDIAEAVYAARGRPPHLTEHQYARLMAAGRHLWDHMGEAPVLLLPCSQTPVLPAREALPPDIAARWEEEAAYAERIRGASIYPAVQNIILACRGLGLGTVITTNHIRCEEEVKVLRDSRGCLDLGVDAGRLADRQIRTVDPPTAARSRARRPLGSRVVRWLTKLREERFGMTFDEPRWWFDLREDRAQICHNPAIF